MKVIHVVEAFSTGIFDFLVDLTNNLPDCEYTIIYGKRTETPLNFKAFFPKNTQFIYWENASRELSLRKDYLALKELVTIFRSLGVVDIIHLHSSKAGFLGRIVARVAGYGNKVIYTPHGVSFLRKDVSYLKYRLFVFLEKIGAKLSGRVIACSLSEAKEFIKLGIQADFVNNAVSIIGFSLPPYNLHATVTIVTIGRISFQKNPALFNEIAEYFLEMPNIKFLWVGEGELSNLLVSKNITVTGWLEKTHVLEQIVNSDIYLSTSLWEGLPISVLQAMHVEKPLVLSNCTGNKDLVQENGYLFDDKKGAIQAIQKLLADTSARQILGEHSMKLVKQSFSIEQMIKGYSQCYLQCQAGNNQ